MFIFNSVGNIDENALNSFSLIINIYNQLQNKIDSKPNSDSQFDSLTSNFPSFLWILRDFALKLEDSDGNKINPKTYLENSLSSQKGLSESIEKKNKIRDLLKNFFKERDCATLIRPVENEQLLQNLQTVDDSQLRKEFLDQINILNKKIFKKVKAKLLNGKAITGDMLADLCYTYTDVLNKDEVPSIDNAWTLLCKSECDKAISTGIDQFRKLINENLINTINKHLLIIDNSKNAEILDNEKDIKQISNICEVYLFFYLINSTEFENIIRYSKKEVMSNFTNILKQRIGNDDTINLYKDNLKNLIKNETNK